MRAYEIPIIYAKNYARTTLERAQSFQMRSSDKRLNIPELCGCCGDPVKESTTDPESLLT